jgi:alpha-1,3-rhamnosyl/mannosyltransferase
MALAQSRIVLTVSEYAADQVSRTLRVKRDRIRVAVEAAASIYRPSESRDDVVAAARRAGVPDGRRWFAYVGGFNPHKHVDAIVRAHAALVRDANDPPLLVLVGALDDDPFFGSQRRIRDEIERSGTADHVRWAGFVPDDELCHLLSGALALVLPSESEGFGLPAVEAAACGVPVIATRESPLPQLLYGGGIFIDPGDEPALASAMRRLANDEPHRRVLGSAALAAAGALSWGASARSALDALSEAAA